MRRNKGRERRKDEISFHEPAATPVPNHLSVIMSPWKRVWVATWHPSSNRHLWGSGSLSDNKHCWHRHNLQARVPVNPELRSTTTRPGDHLHPTPSQTVGAIFIPPAILRPWKTPQIPKSLFCSQFRKFRKLLRRLSILFRLTDHDRVAIPGLFLTWPAKIKFTKKKPASVLNDRRLHVNAPLTDTKIAAYFNPLEGTDQAWALFLKGLHHRQLSRQGNAHLVFHYTSRQLMSTSRWYL